MADEIVPQDPVSALLGEFGTRLNELEEKQRLIKDRILLVGENLISTKEETINQDFKIKRQLKQIDYELKAIKQALNQVIKELPNFARKTELGILERQMKMFQPLEMARIKDVKKMIKEELKKEKIMKQKEIKAKKTL